jgi:hypothetical protein
MKIGHSKSQHLMQMAFGASINSSVRSWKTYILDVALLPETHLKPQFILKHHFHQTDHLRRRKGGTAVAPRKGIPRNNVDLPLLVFIEVTWVSIQNGDAEVLLAVFIKPCLDCCRHHWSYRFMSLLLGDLNTKHPFRRSVVSSTSGTEILNWMHIKYQHHNVPVITLLTEMVMWLILLCTRTSVTIISQWLWHSWLRLPTSLHPLTGSYQMSLMHHLTCNTIL